MLTYFSHWPATESEIYFRVQFYCQDRNLKFHKQIDYEGFLWKK